MAKGLKRSSGGITNIHYHTYNDIPAAGSSTVYGTDYYIPGVGLDQLAIANHNLITPPELSSSVPVYLEDEGASVPMWHRGSLDGPVMTSISPSESGELDLYAKWVYSFYRDTVSFEARNENQQCITLTSGDKIFSWR